MAIGYILWLFGKFSPFGYVVERKVWQPWLKVREGETIFFRTSFS
jgi:hypothetical protein